MMRLISISFLLLLIDTLDLLSQSENDITKQVWIDYNPNWFSRPVLEFRGDIGARKELENNGSWRLVIQPGVRYQIYSNTFITAGVGSFYAFNEIIDDRWEIRPYQGLFIKWPRVKKVYLEHYFRLEERFDFNTTNWESKISLRFRYRLLLVYKFGALAQHHRYWKIRAGGESFITLSGEEGQFQERVRAIVSMERSLRRGFAFRFEIYWQKESLFFLSDESISSIFLRIRLLQSLSSYKLIR